MCLQGKQNNKTKTKQEYTVCYFIITSKVTRTVTHNREVADSNTACIFIRDTAFFYCDPLNCESQFVE